MKNNLPAAAFGHFIMKVNDIDISYQFYTKLGLRPTLSFDALSARALVRNNDLTLFRGGTLGRSAAAEGQFWATENPNLYADYSERYGIPTENTKFDFMEAATLKPEAPFVTRHAPPVGNNKGGAIEVVTNRNSVDLRYWNMP